MHSFKSEHKSHSDMSYYLNSLRCREGIGAVGADVCTPLKKKKNYAVHLKLKFEI